MATSALRKQLVDRVGAGVERDADAGVDRRLDTRDVERHRQCLKEALRDSRRVRLRFDVFEKNREFVTAESGGGVRRAHTRPQPFGNAAEQLVARPVTEAVVDVLEPVEVDEQHGECAGTAIGARECMSDAVLEQRPIGQAGQGVAESLLLVEPPRDDARDARSENEATVDEGPLHRIGDRVGMVVHGLGVEHSEHAVVHDDETDREEERQPVLIQGQEPDHHEEVEVHLDDATAEVDRPRTP